MLKKVSLSIQEIAFQGKKLFEILKKNELRLKFQGEKLSIRKLFKDDQAKL